jgi:IS30 family transposase
MKDEPNLHLTPYRMKHLTRSQRDQLMVLHRAGHKQREIADLIGVDQSSVSRELIRNSSLTGRYTANTAQKRAEKRRKEVDTGLPRWHDDTDLLGHVLNELRDGKSPEQIAGSTEITYPLQYQKSDTGTHHRIRWKDTRYRSGTPD